MGPFVKYRIPYSLMGLFRMSGRSTAGPACSLTAEKTGQTRLMAKQKKRRETTPVKTSAQGKGTLSQTSDGMPSAVEFAVPDAPRPSSLNDNGLLLALVLSGFAALGYQFLWTRLLSLTLGSEMTAILSVLTAFFGGLALGSYCLGRVVRSARHPVLLFALLEIAVSFFVVLTPWLFTGATRIIPPLIASSAGAVGLLPNLMVAVALLLFPAFCMGATFPALAEARRRAFGSDQQGHGPGRLYAANTAGAVAGTLGSTYALLPSLGLFYGSWVLAAIGVASALVAVRWSSRQVGSVSLVPSGHLIDSKQLIGTSQALPTKAGPYLVILFITGLSGIALEMVAVRILAQVMHSTVYTYANLLAVYLFGTALGAWLFSALARSDRGWLSRWAKKSSLPDLLVGLAMTTLASGWAMKVSHDILTALAPMEATNIQHSISELVVAILVFFLPTLLMGFVFSHLIAHRDSVSLSAAYAVNTAGAMAAPVITALILIPWLGYSLALAACGILYFAGALLFCFFLQDSGPAPSDNRLSKRRLAINGLVLVAMIGFQPHLVLISPMDGWRTVSLAQGNMGVTLVSEYTRAQNPERARLLQVDKYFYMGGGIGFADGRMGHIPLILAPQARSVLFLGVGTGATAGAAVRYKNLKRIDAVELVPEVVQALNHFDQINEHIRLDPRTRILTSDARRFVAAVQEPYDLIIGDLFHPHRDGAAFLYTKEHFSAVWDALSTNGIYAQWLPLFQLDPPSLKLVLRTFADAFPGAIHGFLGDHGADKPILVLIASKTPLRVSPDVFGPEFGKQTGEFVASPLDILGAYVFDRDRLLAYAGSGPINTDLNPILLFDAPRSRDRHAKDINFASLESLLPHRAPLPQTLLPAVFDPPEKAAQIREMIDHHATALTHHLQGDILRLRAEHEGKDLLRKALKKYIEADQALPGFPPARAVLADALAQNPGLSDMIYPALIKHSPNEEQLYKQYLDYLARMGRRSDFENVAAMALKNGLGQTQR